MDNYYAHWRNRFFSWLCQELSQRKEKYKNINNSNNNSNHHHYHLIQTCKYLSNWNVASNSCFPELSSYSIQTFFCVWRMLKTQFSKIHTFILSWKFFSQRPLILKIKQGSKQKPPLSPKCQQVLFKTQFRNIIANEITSKRHMQILLFPRWVKSWLLFGGHTQKIPRLKSSGTIFGKRNPNSSYQCLLLPIHKDKRLVLCLRR